MGQYIKMKSNLFASLVKVIEDWSNKEAESADWPDTYWYPGEAEDMAMAASLVFDANVKGQKFAEEQE